MRICKAHLENIPGNPYSQSRNHGTPMLDRETHDAYDLRTWREKCTTNADGQVCIPGMALKQCIDTAAYKLGVKVPGRRATYKTFFTSGLICNGPVPIANGRAITPADAEEAMLYVNADGVRGSNKRVWRRFPVFPKWHGVAELTIVDDILTQDVVEHHVKTAGWIVGIGRFRAEKGGTNGRFRVTRFEWQDLEIA
jgi:hypothetical protein